MKYLIAIIVLSCLSINGFAQETGPDWGRDPWHKLSNVTPESTWKSMMPSLSDHFKKDFPSKSKTATTPRKALLYAVENTTDEATGLTTLRWNDGSSYVGETYRTVFHGMGTMIYPDKGKYYGQWKYSHRDGIGTMVYPDKSKYVGSWERDLPNGSGTFQTPEGITFTVNFENGLPHGKGVIQDLDGRLYSARWVRGKLKEKSIKPYKEE